MSGDLSSIENFNATKNREISIIYINGESLKLLFGVDKKLWDAQTDLNPRLKESTWHKKRSLELFQTQLAKRHNNKKKELTMPANIRFVTLLREY